MLILKPEKVNFKISTTNLLAKYIEDAKVEIIVEGFLINDYIERKKYTEFSIEFNTVAELRCKSVNFGETNYNSFKIIDVKNRDIDDYNFWLNNEYCIDSGFYKVEKSKWLNEMNPIYDPNKNLNLKHFLIEGYDSYVEILAKDYKVNIKKMTEKELIEFIKEYSESDIHYIKCNLEEDTNYDFRMAICEIAKNDFSICSDTLIIDLFIALSNSAKKTFGIYKNYQLFANETLNRGHIKYFEIYLEGATKSFDTLIASGILNLDRQKIIEIIEYLENKNDKNKYELMISRFNKFLEKG